MARVRVYVDAFDVYYGALKDRGPGYKWLDIAALASRCFPGPGHTIDKVVYCTARVADPATTARQGGEPMEIGHLVKPLSLDVETVLRRTYR